MEITTDRLRLRDLIEEDWKVIHRIVSHPSVRLFLLPGQASEAYVRRWVETGLAQPEVGTWLHDAFMIHRQGDDEPIGVCSLTMADPFRRIASLGWDLAPEYWRRGYATEAAQAVVQVGFERRAVNRIRSDCFQDNRASRRVMEKLGMRHKDDWRTRLALFLMYPENRKKVRYELSSEVWHERCEQAIQTLFD